MVNAFNHAKRFVAKHRQAIEQVATIAIAVVGMGACDAFTGGACSVFTPYVGALVSTAVYAEGGGKHTGLGYAVAFGTGGLVGDGTLVSTGVIAAGAGVISADSVIGAVNGAYDYSHRTGNHSFVGYL